MGIFDFARRRSTAPAIVEDSVSSSRKELTDIISTQIEKSLADYAQNKASGRVSLSFSPYSFLSNMGKYKERTSALTFSLLRKMSYQTPVISAIINTRTNQVASFSLPQRDRFTPGFVIRLREVRRSPKAAERKECARLSDFIMHTGQVENRLRRDNFDTFLRKITRDSLTFDQTVFEIVPDRKGDPAELYAVDAATVRLAANLKDNSGNALSVDENVDYVQVIDNRVVAEFSAHELAFGLRNPRNDIYANGYGLGELEMLVNVVTAILFAEEYNKSFFSKGSAPKGILLLKGSIPDEQMEAFRRQFWAQVTGIENCLAGDSTIWTPTGAVELEKFLDGAEERQTKIWTGEQWCDGLVYKTGLKVPVKTTLGNGVSVTTSPDHKFRVLNEEGVPDWKEQKQLQIGDFVLVNKKSVESDYVVPAYQGKPITSELMETLGWMIGDGYFSFEGSGHQKLNYVQWFYHHDNEEDILRKHLDVITSFDSAAEFKEYQITDEEKDKIRERYGFKDVANRRIFIQLCSVRFAEWLDSVGFKTSKAGKVVPGFVHSLPKDFKAAFLRGLFSADGNNAKRRSPECSISSDILRAQVKLLLLSLGIRTSLSEGRTKIQIKGKEREPIEAKFLLRIKDRDAFFREVGFLQPHKQPQQIIKENESNKRSCVAHSTVLRFLRLVREANNLSGKTLLSMQERADMNSIFSGADGCSLPRLLRLMTKTGVEVPSWLTDYHFEPVVGIELLHGGEQIQMYDVEIRNDVHAFATNSIICHNSWRTPIINTENGQADAQWLDLQRTNREMEYRVYMDYLTRVACGVYLIDPAEINFQSQGGGSQQVTFESKQEQRIKYSRDRGLRPLLQHIAWLLNKHVIWPLNPDLEFAFEGLNTQSKEELAERVKGEVQYYKTVNEVREEQDLAPLPDPVGSMILNQIVVMAQQQAQIAQNPNTPQGAPGVPGMPTGGPPQSKQPAGEAAENAGDGDLSGNGKTLFDYTPEELQSIAKSVAATAPELQDKSYDILL